MSDQSPAGRIAAFLDALGPDHQRCPGEPEGVAGMPGPDGQYHDLTAGDLRAILAEHTQMRNALESIRLVAEVMQATVTRTPAPDPAGADDDDGEVRIAIPGSGVVITYRSQRQRDQPLRLAEARQQLAHEGTFLPAWSELTPGEQETSAIEARNYMNAIDRAGLAVYERTQADQVVSTDG
jgi:hypothetical protein